MYHIIQKLGWIPDKDYSDVKSLAKKLDDYFNAR